MLNCFIINSNIIGDYHMSGIGFFLLLFLIFHLNQVDSTVGDQLSPSLMGYENNTVKFN